MSYIIAIILIEIAMFGKNRERLIKIFGIVIGVVVIGSMVFSTFAFTF